MAHESFITSELQDLSLHQICIQENFIQTNYKRVIDSKLPDALVINDQSPDIDQTFLSDLALIHDHKVL